MGLALQGDSGLLWARAAQLQAPTCLPPHLLPCNLVLTSPRATSLPSCHPSLLLSPPLHLSLAQDVGNGPMA